MCRTFGSPRGARFRRLLFIYAVMMVSVSFEIARRIVGPLIPLIGFLFFIYAFESYRAGNAWES